ncbi:FecR family protein [Parasediminibacterium sp. JCM 36343]|uniref:FecR family protein n=1 Tax=Parasediminibacterium sp. JCM 36343 TaxID=3374279 RepID=UPI00397B78A8
MKKIDEILVDEGFIDWASNQQSILATDWQKWMVEHPAQSSNVDEALKLFKNLQLEEIKVQGEVIEFEKNRLMAALDTFKKPAKVVYVSRLKWLGTAAACIMLVAAGLYTFSEFFGKTVQKTSFGEIAEKVLPDGSSVLLNSNSSVSYAADWAKSKQREVWINGEAFFHISKKPNHERFVVHTDNFDIVVTGTKFNVLNRKNKSTVMLQEGGVTIQLQNGKEIKLHPGEYINYSAAMENETAIKPETGKEEKELAWVSKRLFFENTSMVDVCEKIKELYGVEMELGSDSVAKKTISGILPNDNLDILLQSLEATADFKLERKGNTITINLPN